MFFAVSQKFLLKSETQGSLLGPILYILYNSPLYGISLLHDVMSHFYADDTKFYKRFKMMLGGAAQQPIIDSQESGCAVRHAFYHGGAD